MKKIIKPSYRFSAVIAMLIIAIILTYINTEGTSDGLRLRYGFPFYFYMVHDFGEMINGHFIPVTSWRVLDLIFDFIIWILLVFGVGYIVEVLITRKKENEVASPNSDTAVAESE